MELPELVLDEPTAARVIGLCTRNRLDPVYANAVQQHYNQRGCIVIDMDQQAEPLVSAMPLLTATDVWARIRIELLRGLVCQLSHAQSPVIFLNMRAGPEVQYLQELLPGLSLFHVITNEQEVTDDNFIPVLDLTQLYPHVLDSLL